MYGNNFYNPFNYNSFIPRGINLGSKGKILSLFKKFNFSSFLSGTSKTLNVINQAIPVYYQIKPLFSNAKTIFKIANAVKSNNINTKEFTNNIVSNNTPTIKNDSNPVFFV